MSTLLKAGDERIGTTVRPFRVEQAPERKAKPEMAATGHAVEPAPASDLPIEACPESQSIIHIAELERQIQRLNEDLRNAAVSADARETEAFARGEQEGARNAQSRADELVKTLHCALETATQELSRKLENLEVLSLEVAQTALARIFGDKNKYAQMAADSVSHHLRRIESAIVLRVRLSREDFADEQALNDLVQRFPGVEIGNDPALASGQCIIDLSLGRIEAGIGEQWQRLSQFLDTLAIEGEDQ